MGKQKDKNKEPAKGGDQSKKKDKASKDNAAAEAAAAAAAEIEALKDPPDAGRERPQPRRQSAKGGSTQPESGEDEESSDDGKEGPALAAQSRHVNTDLARQCAELQKALAAAEVTIPSGRVLMHLIVFFFW